VIIKKNPPAKTGGDKEEAKMLTQNTKSAFRKQKPPKTFQYYISKFYVTCQIIFLINLTIIQFILIFFNNI